MDMKELESTAESFKSKFDEHQQKLLLALEFSPTALRLAVAYIKSRHEEKNTLGSKFHISDYLRQYENKKKELLDSLDFQNEEAKIVYATFQLTYSHILKMENGSMVIEMMNIVSYLASGDIPLESFSILSQNEPGLEPLSQTLHRFAIVNFDEKRQVFNVDTLVQQAINRNHGTGEKERILEKALDLLKCVEVDSSNVRHAVSIWNHAIEYDCLMKRFHSLACVISYVYYSTSDCHLESVEFAERALQIAKSVADAQCIELNFKKALEIYQEVHRCQEEVFGCDSGEARDTMSTIKTIKAFCNLRELLTLPASSFLDCGVKKDETTTKSLVMRMIERMGKVIRLSTMNTLALNFFAKDEYRSSLDLFNQVIQEKKDLLGPDHPSVLFTQKDVATNLSRLNKQEESLRLYRETIDKQKKVMGPDDRNTLFTQYEMAVALYNIDKYEEALSILSQVHEMSNRVFGPDDLHTLDTLQVKAQVLCFLGKSNEAVKILGYVFPKRWELLGQDHEDTLCSQMWFGDTLCDNDQPFMGFQMLNESYFRQRIVNGDEHPLTLLVKKKAEKWLPCYKDSILIAINEGVNSDINANGMLICVISSGTVEAVETLLSRGADITGVTSGNGYTTLHIAALGGNEKIVDILLEHAKRQFDDDPRKLNVFVDAKAIFDGKTSLHVAAERGYRYIAMSLLKHGATYNLMNKLGDPPVDCVEDNYLSNLLELIDELFKRTKRGNVGVIEKLADLDSDRFRVVTSARDKEGRTLMQAALDNGHKNIATEILRIMRNKQAD